MTKKLSAQQECPSQQKLQEWQDFFCVAMLHILSGDCHEEFVFGKRLRQWGEEALSLVVAYTHCSISRFSSETITIIDDKIEVWRMVCTGRCDKDATELLELACKYAYEQKIFRGGRGITLDGTGEGTSLSDGKVYINWPRGEGFCRFSGKDQVSGANKNTKFGFYEYDGGLMNPAPPYPR